jgi:tetratricopeptide (TPR) repeat protein
MLILQKKTKDIEAAKRATELSLTLGDHDTALTTAKIWKNNSINDSDASEAVDALQLVLGKTDELIESMQTRRTDAKNNQTLDSFYDQLASLVKKARDPSVGLLIFEEVSQDDRNLPEVLYTSALLHFNQGDVSKMEFLLRKLIDLKPDHANALNALGYSLADRGENLFEAERLIKAAMIFSPNDAHIIDSMGWLHYRKGDLLKAEEYLSIAFNNQPDPEISAHYGEVLWMLASKKEAISIWRLGFNQSSNNKILLETLTRFKISVDQLLNDENETVNSL